MYKQKIVKVERFLIIDANTSGSHQLLSLLKRRYERKKWGWARVENGGIYHNSPENMQILIYSETISVEEVEDWLYNQVPGRCDYTGVVEMGKIKKK